MSRRWSWTERAGTPVAVREAGRGYREVRASNQRCAIVKPIEWRKHAAKVPAHFHSDGKSVCTFVLVVSYV